MGAQAMATTHGGGGGGGGGGVHSRQGSLCSLTLSEVEGQLHGVNLDDLLRTAGGSGSGAGRKTVDEVWWDIQGTTQMTLEDFLSRAGGSGARWSSQQQYHPPSDAPSLHGHHHVVGRPLPRPLGVGAGPVLDALYHDGAMSGRKRGPAAPEKTVERRKKRMIKNRESAARSRARKQAYTNELENKISQLEEENERLRNHKVFEPVVQDVPQQNPKNQLRRVNSADF